MNEKINLIELLKDCPKGMELDCTIWDSEAKVFLKRVLNRVLNDDFAYPIEVTVKYNNIEYTKSFTKYGAFNNLPYCKCVIFPKGKTTWEGFQRPFVDGDVVYVKAQFEWIIIKKDGGEYITKSYIKCDPQNKAILIDGDYICEDESIKEIRLATEEEKTILFQVIKDNGYKWDPETKTLEKLIVPKFKVGDRLVWIRSNKNINKENMDCYIKDIENDRYVLSDGFCIPFMEQNNYKLAPNKFDPKTLRPFYKVLVTDSLSKTWYAGFLSYIDEENKTYPFVVGFGHHRYCIPYNDDTKHLAGKSGKAPEFYRYWEE